MSADPALSRPAGPAPGPMRGRVKAALGALAACPGRHGVWRLAPRGLHGRLLWLVSLVTLLTVVALGLHTVASESALALAGARHQAGAVARGLALASVNALLTDQLDQAEQTLLRSAAYPGVVALQLIDADGAIVGHAQAGADGQPRLVFEPLRQRLVPPDSGRPVTELQAEPHPGRLVAWHPVEAGARLGWARAELQPDLLDALQRQVLWRTLAAGALVVLGSSLALLWLLRRPMAALAEARDFAAGLTRADGRQLALDPTGPAEVLDLGRALNGAAQRLAEQHATIHAKVEELARQRAELHDSHLQLASVFALSPDGLVTFDAAGRVRHANPAFGHLTGLAVDAVVGWTQAELEAQLRVLCAEPEAWVGLAPYFAAGAAAEAAAARPEGPLLRLAAPRARVLSVLGRQAAGLGRAGEPATEGNITRLLYLRDVTHETEVDRLKSEFLSTAAHELRTPLASIHGFAELLCTPPFPEERRAQMLAAVHRNSGVMVHILNDLLDLARLEARRDSDFDCQPGDLAALVGRVLADGATPPGREPPLLLGGGGPLPARFDAGKMAQVLGNLLGNAYKYSPAGGPVRVRLLRDLAPGRPLRVGFEVSDNGIGMAPEQVARVFERFYRADPSGTILGTGLGMSIVREIVTLHGGEVAVDSQPGQGTAVRVWLPLSA